MLVDIRQVVKSFERVDRGVSGTVWLQIRDHCLRLRRNATDSLFPPRIASWLQGNRKLAVRPCSIRQRSAVRHSKLICEVIKRGPEIVEHVANQRTEYVMGDRRGQLE